VELRSFATAEAPGWAQGTIHFFATYPLKSSDYNEETHARAMEGLWFQ